MINRNVSTTQIMKTLKATYGYIFQDKTVSKEFKEMLRDAVASAEKKLMLLEDDGK